MIMVQRGQKLARISGRAREQDHVVRTFDDVDRIELDETELADQRQDLGMGRPVAGPFAERMAIEKQPPRIGVGDDEFGHQERSENGFHMDTHE